MGCFFSCSRFNTILKSYDIYSWASWLIKFDFSLVYNINWLYHKLMKYLFSLKYLFSSHFMQSTWWISGIWCIKIRLIGAREKLTVCDVTNLPYMDINRQPISIYGSFVTSLTAYNSCADTTSEVTNHGWEGWNEKLRPATWISGGSESAQA